VKNKPALFFFLIATLFAFIAAFLSVSAVKSFNKQEQTVVADKDIPPYTKITKEMVKVEAVPATSIVGTKLTKLEDIVGKYSNTSVKQGMSIPKESISETPGGQVTVELNSQKQLDIRALPIPVTAISGFGGTLDKGDRVDFIATVTANTNQGNNLVTTTIAQDIPIISRVEEGGKLIGVVIEGTAQQIQDISHYMETGKMKIAVQPQPANHQGDLKPTMTQGFVVSPTSNPQPPTTAK
jgi:Flp pilus assembly protein CpaB